MCCGGNGRIRDEKKEERDMDWRPEEKEEGVRIREEKEEEGLERRRRSDKNRRIEIQRLLGIYWKHVGLLKIQCRGTVKKTKTKKTALHALGHSMDSKYPIPNKQPFPNEPLELFNS